MCSFAFSPDPRATQRRPGNIAASVALAWAITAGWYRWPGALTVPKVRSVVARAAPSQDHANPDWPWRSLHGAKWSEHMAGVEPGVLGAADGAEQLGGMDLLVRGMEAEDRHVLVSTVTRRAPLSGSRSTHGLPCMAADGTRPADLPAGSGRGGDGRVRTRW